MNFGASTGCRTTWVSVELWLALWLSGRRRTQSLEPDERRGSADTSESPHEIRPEAEDQIPAASSR